MSLDNPAPLFDPSIISISWTLSAARARSGNRISPWQPHPVDIGTSAVPGSHGPSAADSNIVASSPITSSVPLNHTDLPWGSIQAAPLTWRGEPKSKRMRFLGGAVFGDIMKDSFWVDNESRSKSKRMEFLGGVVFGDIMKDEDSFWVDKHFQSSHLARISTLSGVETVDMPEIHRKTVSQNPARNQGFLLYACVGNGKDSPDRSFRWLQTPIVFFAQGIVATSFLRPTGVPDKMDHISFSHISFSSGTCGERRQLASRCWRSPVAARKDDERNLLAFPEAGCVMCAATGHFQKVYFAGKTRPGGRHRFEKPPPPLARGLDTWTDRYRPGRF
ncbi:hypothetical protein BDK51DRAFT_40205 [Blyttiomyces helicus]|uniref:Uncharacterized protein n=1 Tax=Blyttiomyces helicus TaxID=388810 RepID=A0A4V1IR79_9FUNG|nr:hypothetical protein BDK51DRAFT_40205 [Blyttiomyces helicus]|eukprot:RKO89117.1 hypothetical protein BDK51DRAFT_40205 [Blyttiomyces helicus]